MTKKDKFIDQVYFNKPGCIVKSMGERPQYNTKGGGPAYIDDWSTSSKK